MGVKEKKEIIIVDDEEMILRSSRKILLSEGYSVDTAVNAEDALKLMDVNSYKLMITDLMMPGISGFQLVENVRLKFPMMPVIVITGYATLNNIVETFNHGAFDFIPKPFTVDELLSVVSRGLNYTLNSLSFSKYEEYLKSFTGEKKLENYYFLGNHSWVKFNDDGTARIGLGISFAKSMGEIKDIDLPESNHEMTQGSVFAGINSGNNMNHRVISPVSGRVIEHNQAILKDYDLINSDPFFNGWLTRIVPKDLERELVFLQLKTEKVLFNLGIT